MDFAADAVLDTIAPPQRPAPARAPEPASDQPSFDDHLAAATREDETTPRTETAARDDQSPDQMATDQPSAPDSQTDEIVVAAAPQVAVEQPASPVFVQLIVETAPAQSTESQQLAAPNAAPATEPCAPAPSTPMPAAANADDGPVTAPIDAAPASTPKTEKSSASAEKSATPAQQPTQAAPTAEQPQATPVQAPAPTVAAPVAQTAELPSAAAIAPVQPQAAPEHFARQPKAALPRGDQKADPAPAGDRATAPVANIARATARTAAPANASKEAIAFTPTEAPDAAPQQQLAASTPASGGSTHAQHATADQTLARAAPATQQVAREIVRRFDGGNTRFELRLDPPELGRVEVRLDVSRDHRVTAVIAADSLQALTELARHARDLEQMLQGAGLQLSDSGLSFDLRQGSERAETAEFGGSTGEAAAQIEDAAPVAARPLGYERWRGVRVDMMV